MLPALFGVSCWRFPLHWHATERLNQDLYRVVYYGLIIPVEQNNKHAFARYTYAMY